MRGLRGGMARMMESIHAELESFGWKTEFFTNEDMPAAGSERFRRYAFPLYVRRHAREAFLRGEPYEVINIHEPAGAAVVVGQARIGGPAIVAMSHGLEQRYWEMRLRKDPPGPRASIMENSSVISGYEPLAVAFDATSRQPCAVHERRGQNFS
jgi:hypothetical protein